MSPVTSVESIAFTYLHPSSDGAVMVSRKLEWGLGVGPCGRFVDDLQVSITLTVLRIRQVSLKDDPTVLYDKYLKTLEKFDKGKAKAKAVEDARSHWAAAKKDRKVESFIYKIEDVLGRIQFTEKLAGL